MSNYYRNKKDLLSPEGDYVEAGSLWQLIKDRYILEDQDRFVASQDHCAFAKA